MDLITSIKKSRLFKKVSKKRGKPVYKIEYKDLIKTFIYENNKLYGVNREFETIKIPNRHYVKYKEHLYKKDDEVFSTIDEVVKSFEKDLKVFKGA